MAIVADASFHDERLLIASEDAFEAASALDVFNAAVLRDVLVIAAAFARALFGGRG